MNIIESSSRKPVLDQTDRAYAPYSSSLIKLIDINWIEMFDKHDISIRDNDHELIDELKGIDIELRFGYGTSYLGEIGFSFYGRFIILDSSQSSRNWGERRLSPCRYLIRKSHTKELITYLQIKEL